MAFQEEMFAPVSATSSPAPVWWRYDSGADNQLAVETAGYFDFAEVWQKAATGDVITCVMSDATVIYKLTVVNNVATGSVTLSTGTEIL